MTPAASTDPVRVLLVDDSAVIRGFVTRALADLPDVRIIASVGDGAAAIAALKREVADIIILDIEMPVMTGLQALPELVKIAPHARIIMSSTLTSEGAEVTLRAMALGAADYVTKPTSTREQNATDDWRRDLIAKIEALGSAARRQRTSRTAPTAAQPAAAAAAPINKSRLYDGAAVKLREPARQAPAVIAIGSSTGGPQALFQVMPHLKGVRQPIVITQHMPKAFTTILADHISRQTGVPCLEAKTGDVLEAGRAYLAPGDYHLLFERKGEQVVTILDQGPPESFCRPAVDPMLRSLVKAYTAPKIIIAILTGMGADGQKSCEQLTASGGTVVAQDQATSVVWGMPGAVATTGLCSAVLPLGDIGPYLHKFAARV